MLKEYHINKKDNLFYLGKDDIENETENLLITYYPKCLEKASPTPIEILITDLDINIDYVNLSPDSSCYGAFVFNKGILNIFDDFGNPTIERYDAKTILIDKKIYELQQGITFFTLAHELGHYYLQYKLKHVDENQVSIFDIMSNEENAKFVIDTQRELSGNLSPSDELYKFSFLEWQPNYFASSILMPKKTLDTKLREEVKEFKKLQLYSTLKNLNKYDYEKVINNVKSIFNVSKQALENRLKTLEYI